MHWRFNAWFSKPDRTRRSDRENRESGWNRFFKPKESDFLLISWTAKTCVGPHEPVRTMRSNPLAIKKKKKQQQQQLNTILFYLIKLSIFYKE